MSAPAPALAKVRRGVVTVRLADPALALAGLSVAFALGLVFSPVLFPELIVRAWQRGHLLPAMMVIALVLDAAIYTRVAQMLSTRPRLLVAICLGSLPLLIVAGLGALFEGAVSRALIEYPSNASARVAEEVLAHTYFTMVAAVFVPFLLIRVVQQFNAAGRNHNAETRQP